MPSPLLLLALAGSQAAQNPPPAQAEVAIVNVRVEVGDGTVLPKTNVYIKDGRVVAIREEETWPAGVLTIDGAGKTLYPGFIDAFTSKGVKAPPDFSGDGRPNAIVTAPATLWVANRKGITPEWKASENLVVERDEQAYQAGITTAHLCAARGSLRGTGVILDLLPASLSTRVLSPQSSIGLSFRSGAGPGYPSNLLGVIALKRQTLADAQSLKAGTLFGEPDKPPAWQKSLEALQPLLEKKVKGWYEVALEREVFRALQISEEFGFDMVVVGGREAHLQAQALKARSAVVVYSPDLGNPPSADPPRAGTPAADAPPQEYRQERVDLWKQRAAGPLVLHQAGLLKAFTSEGMSYAEFLPGVRNVIQQGLPREAALRALTLGAAELLGLDKDLGTLAVRKRANLVLMSAPFDDKDAKVERVWIDGRPIFAPKEAAK